MGRADAGPPPAARPLDGLRAVSLSSCPATPLLKTLVLSDLVESTDLTARVGDVAFNRLSVRHDRLVRDLVRRTYGLEIEKTDGFLLLFDRPIDAVAFALDYHRLLTHEFSGRQTHLRARVGIHLGEILLRANEPVDVLHGANPYEVEGLAKPMVARITSLGHAGQTLLSRGAFDIARRAAVDSLSPTNLAWLAHGPYLMAGIDEAVEVFEVGIEGMAPLSPPVDAPKARRSVSAADETTLGWRPAIGQSVPLRPNWMLERKLGDGSVGEVWLAAQVRTGEKRVFKFCFHPERVRALKREVSLFRVLKIGLGAREDIAHVIDWNFDQAPYFRESAYTGGGDLIGWADRQGGIASVPMETRLEIAARVGDAVAAAHSVGVLHKDIKPANVLVQPGPDVVSNVQLADFGIGLLTDDVIVEGEGLTPLGFTDIDPRANESRSGTRLYLAPEILEGKPPTPQSDIYALGVLLYQLVVGNLKKALPQNWEQDIDDEVLVEDLSVLLDGRPNHRPRTASEFSNRLRTREQRRRNAMALRSASEEAARATRALAMTRRRRRVALGAAVLLLAVAGLLLLQERRTAREAFRANREAAVAQRVTDVLVSMFEAADPFESVNADMTAREVVDRGAARIRSDATVAPAIRIRLLAALGAVYQNLSAFDQAEIAFRDAISAAETLRDVEALGELYYGLGVALREQGRLSRAHDAHRVSLDVRLRLAGPDHPSVVSSLFGLAEVLSVQGDVSAARAYFERALQLDETLNPEPTLDRAAMLDGLANVVMNGAAPTDRGARQQGIRLARDALAIREKVAGRDSILVAWSLNNLAFWLQREDAVPEAESMHRRALRIKRMAYGSRHVSTATTQANLADSLFVQGRVEEATALLETALAVLEALLPADHWRIAHGRSVLGACLALLDPADPDAERYLRDGYQTLEQDRDGSATLTQEALARLNDYYRRRGAAAATG